MQNDDIFTDFKMFEIKILKRLKIKFRSFEFKSQLFPSFMSKQIEENNEKKYEI